MQYCMNHWFCKTCHKWGDEQAERCCNDAEDKGRTGPPILWGTPSASGEKGGKPSNARSEELATSCASIIATSRNEGVDAAIQRLAEEQPEMFLRSFTNVKAALSHVAKRSFEAFPMPETITALRPWQQRVWDLIHETPKNRRIIWVSLSPEAGKSVFVTYMQAHYKHGVMSACLDVAFAGLILKYKGQGLALWDLPKTYDFDKFRDHLCMCLEKFSDRGQILSCTKYNGNDVTANCHVLVFSNSEPPDGIRHRDLVYLTDTDAEELATRGKRARLQCTSCHNDVPSLHNGVCPDCDA
jgi:hypothetical protein